MSLNLDPRQRAMLEEMRVKVWSPLTQPAAQPAAPHAAVATAEARESVARLSVPREPAAATVRSTTPADTTRLVLQPRVGGVEALNWTALQRAVADCRACALCTGRKHTVFGMGGLRSLSSDQPPVADWLIVGEAPGEQEDLSGLPFVGPAGQLLDNMLKAVGLDRQREAPVGNGRAAQGTYIANVLKCRPPSNRNPEGDEVAQCLPYLRRQIELLQPKIILAMGRFAAQALLYDSVPDAHSLPLGKLRGQVHQYRGIPVVVTYHPAYLLRALGDKAKAWADLCLAMQTFSALTQSKPGIDTTHA